MRNQRSNRGRSAARRRFLKATTAAAAAANLRLVGGVHAGASDAIKVGLIGCGGRGNGAALDALQADPAVRVVAVADVFNKGEKGAHHAVRALEARGQKISPDHVFVGFDAYKKLVQLDLDYVILATPPHFRPAHLEAAVNAGKHVFTEKPVAVDPPGARLVIKMGKLAQEKGLSIVAGTQRRHEQAYLEAYKRVQDGAIGRILAARCYWNQGQLWYRDRNDPQFPDLKNCSDMEWMLRDWVNWCWLSGDHIVEQHVHNLDVVNWFSGMHPVKAVGMGGRAHRVTGDQYDYFAVDFEYPDGMHLLSQCRQVNACANNVTETLVGEKGWTYTQSGSAQLGLHTGSDVWRFDGRKQRQANPYVQEHKDLIDSIRQHKGLNEANNVATSTLTAIMGRIAAYTGRDVTWDEMMKSDVRLGPKEYSWEIALFPREIPRAGRA
jgi:predicted dehydrogenase